MKSVMERISFYLQHRAGENLQIGAIVFSNEEGILGQTENAEMILKMIQDQDPESGS